MAKSKETYNKKEKEKKRLKKKRDKEVKKEQRKADKEEGKSFEDMIMYVDENGNLTPDPPDPSKRRKVRAEDIVIGVPKQEDFVETVKKGTITYFNEEKGYGFIREKGTQDSIFVHVNNLVDQVNVNDRVTYEVENGPKGPVAVDVRLFKM
ncbi:MAG: cold shock domain-containing protein [Lewinellaceae bacterium]|nr:cold shock domain-containing protein [Saprospiraceae bacterium]MCB9336564.1 cold shock domain-containing protein [Lewinellaceae bacterium]